jgi:hypothetical protein
MGLFGNKKDERKLSFALGGYTFTADDRYVSYKSIYGKFFRVARKDIESVSLDKGGMGKNLIKVNGRGTTLAQLEMPKQWAEKAQEFIMNEALGSGKQSASGVDDLEKLSALKEKGVITEEEFKAKKKQILGL